MDSRQREVIVDPTATQLANAAATTGVSVSSPVLAVSVEPSASGGYRLGVVPVRQPAVTEVVSEESPEPIAVESVPPEVSPADAIAELSEPMMRAGDDGSLIGPPGSRSGSLTVDFPFSDRLDMLRGPFQPRVIRDQTFRSSCENTFYVYWVDGSEPPPHYLVILRQHAFFGAGEQDRGMAHNDPALRGFGMFSASTDVLGVRANNGQATLVRTSPATGERGAHVRVDVRMTQDVQGGRAIARATMQEAFPLALDGWTAYNRSSPPSAGWQFAQDNTLDGGLSGQRLVNTHFAGQTVRPFPAITMTGLTARTYAVWRVRGGRDATLTVSLRMQQHFMMLANGAVRPRGQNYRGCWTDLRVAGPIECTLDLRAITEQR